MGRGARARAKDGPLVRMSRISDAFLGSVIKTHTDLAKPLTPEQQGALQESDTTYFVDRKGMQTRLTVEEMRIVRYALSKVDVNDELVRYAIGRVRNACEQGIPNFYVPIQVTTKELASEIIGTTKFKDISKMGVVLQTIAGKKQIQEYKVDGKARYTTVRSIFILDNVKYEKYSKIRDSRGLSKDNESDDSETDELLFSATIVLTPLVFLRLADRFAPFRFPKYNAMCKKNRCGLLQTMLAYLEYHYMQHYKVMDCRLKEYTEAHPKIAKYKGEKYDNAFENMRKKAMLHIAKTNDLFDICATDYAGNRKMIAKKTTDLQTCIDSLIEYGIITEETTISKDGNQVNFMYNYDFSKMTEEEQITERIEAQKRAEKAFERGDIEALSGYIT